MKKLLLSHAGKDYYINGHSNHRMKVRRITPDDICVVLKNPLKEESLGYSTLVEGFSEDGKKVRIYYRQKPTGYREILTAIKEGR